MSVVAIAPRLWLPTRAGAETVWGDLERDERSIVDRFFRKGVSLKDRLVMMAGSDTFYLSKKLGDLAFGKTAYAGATTVYGALYTAAIDDTFNGGTSNESAYTSYVRLSLSNSATIFAAGTGTTTYSKSWPADAAKNWATSTGSSSTVTYIGFLDGNAGTSGDNGLVWASITSATVNSGDTPQLAQNGVTQIRD